MGTYPKKTKTKAKTKMRWNFTQFVTQFGANTIVHEWFWHELNYFLICQIFEKLFITFVGILIIIIKLNSEGFELQTY
jgi:hypothetical protein